MSLVFLKNRCNCPSLVNVGSSFSFLNFVISSIISKIFLSYISLSRITTALPLPGLTIAMSFLVFSFFEIPCFLNVFWVGLYENQYTIRRPIILMTFLFDQIFLPWALIIAILLDFSLNFLIQLYQKSIVQKIRLVFEKKYNR